MAWTAPKTYTVGELLTAADMNLYQRDNLEAGFPHGTTWQIYTPTLTAVTTDPTLGTGSTQDGRYYRVGQLVVVQLTIQFGTSGTAAGSGEYRVSTPINSQADREGSSGWGWIEDNSASSRRPVAAYHVGNTALRLLFNDGIVGAGSPWAWAASDLIRLNVTYEVA